jgi:predicted AlkP superfamily pyrophosphatase or phosphodiesterase
MMGVSPLEISEDTIIGALEEYARTKGIGRVDKCLVYAPDAIGTKIHDEHSQLFQRVLDHAPLKVPMRAVFPTVTPVCFASMFTGATPERHGITKYDKPVLQCDTLFDALIRAGKKPAIVAVEGCSISLIFRNREMDYFIETYDEQVVERAIQLIEEDRHDFILAYNQEYDDVLHRTTPYSEEAIRALRNHVSAFDRIARAFEAHWKDYDRLIMFMPDHGAHISATSGRGTHGEDIPEDMLVNHFVGVYGAGAG